MNKKSNHRERIYYTIGEVADIFNINTSTIRYWEKEFDIIKPRRNNKGNRYFTTEDVENFHLIYHLVKESGYTLNGAKEKIKKDRRTSEKESEISARLKEIRRFLVELRSELD